jgi:hypothetical protein
MREQEQIVKLERLRSDGRSREVVDAPYTFSKRREGARERDTHRLVRVAAAAFA